MRWIPRLAIYVGNSRPAKFYASPALADGILFFGIWDSDLYAVDAKTGKEKWRFHAGEDPLIHNQVGFHLRRRLRTVWFIPVPRCELVRHSMLPPEKKNLPFFNDLSWVITSPAVADGKRFRDRTRVYITSSMQTEVSPWLRRAGEKVTCFRHDYCRRRRFYRGA